MAKKKDDEVILQFFEEYDMEVGINALDDKGVKTNLVEESFVLTGKLKSPKNITIISKELFDKASERCRPFAGWIKMGVLVVLDDVPQSFYDAKEIAAEARQKVAEAEKKLTAADQQLQAKDDEIAKLKAELKGYGAK